MTETATTYHGIVKAECLSCHKVTTDAMSLEAMNDLDPMCDVCGARHVRWTLADGTVSDTQEDEDGNGHTHTEVSPADPQAPTITLGRFREMTKDLDGDLPLTVYIPSTGWWVNLQLDAEIPLMQLRAQKRRALDEPDDAEPSLVLNAVENFDTRQW